MRICTVAGARDDMIEHLIVIRTQTRRQRQGVVDRILRESLIACCAHSVAVKITFV